MDLSELHRVQRQERSTDSLQELRESFYEDVAAYITSLREERSDAAAEAEDPFRSARVSELTSEIETAEHVAEAIYQRRIGKLVDEASLAATGNGSRTTGLTAEEKALYEDLVDRISDNKEAVLGRFSGDFASAETETAVGATTDAETPGSSNRPPNESGEDEERDAHPPDQPLDEAGPSPAAAMGGDLDAEESSQEGGADAEESPEDETVERTTVRMTADVGEIFGVDAESYDLKRDDVVDLPRENADPLLDRDVAERVE